MEKVPKIGWVYCTQPLFRGATMGSAQILWTSSNCPWKCLVFVGNTWILKPRVLKTPPWFMFLILSIVILSTWNFLTLVNMILAALLWVVWCKCNSHSETNMKFLKAKNSFWILIPTGEYIASNLWSFDFKVSWVMLVVWEVPHSFRDLQDGTSPSFSGPLRVTMPRHVLALTVVVVRCPDAVNRGFAGVNVGGKVGR